MELAALYRELLAAGYAPAEIPGIIQRLAQAAEQQRQRLLGMGYPQTYVSALSGPQLFGTTGLPVVTGQVEIDREAQARRDLETALGTRAAAGGGLLDFYRQMYADVDAAERSPFNYTDYLRNYRDLPAGTGDPVQSLLSEGKYIEPKLPTIWRDPNVRGLLDVIGDYARSIGDVRGNARGGAMMMPEPIIGVGAITGRPHFTAAENGPERIRFEPLPGVSRRMDRGRQRAILGMAGFPDGGSAVAAPPWATVKQPKYPVSRFFGMMASGRIRFGARQGDADFDPRADLNDDGIINSTDQFVATQPQYSAWAPMGRRPEPPASPSPPGTVEPGPATPPVDFPVPRRPGTVGNRPPADPDDFPATGKRPPERQQPTKGAPGLRRPIRFGARGRIRAPRRIPAFAAGGSHYGFGSAEEAMKFRDATKGASTAQLSALSRMAGGAGDLFDRGGKRATPVDQRSDDYLRHQYGFSDEFMTDPRFEGFRERIRTYGPAGTNPFAKREELERVGRFRGYDTYGNEIYENATRPSHHNRPKNGPFRANDGTEVTTSGYAGPRFRGAAPGLASGASGGTASPGGTQGLSPRQALADMLYNSLANVSYVHPDMLAALQRNEAPPPSTLTQRFLANVDPEIFDLLFGSLYPAYGFRNREALLQSAQRYWVPGMATTTRR